MPANLFRSILKVHELSHRKLPKPGSRGIKLSLRKMSNSKKVWKPQSRDRQSRSKNKPPTLTTSDLLTNKEWQRWCENRTCLKVR